MYTVTEKEMILSLVAYLEDEGKNELASILKASDFVFEPQWEFSGIVSNQRRLYASLRVPITFRKIIENELKYLSEIACNIYQDDKEYAFYGFNSVGIKPINVENIEVENKHIIFEKDSIYANFIKYCISCPGLPELQKKYLFEACECGQANNMLSATVMLGASAEMLLLDLCEAYGKYLSNQGDATALEAYERKVIKARCANDRLTEFLKRANSNADIFKRLGFEDIMLNFNFLDIIRKTRNDSGHPTGNTVTEEQFKMMLGNYQAFLPKMLHAIQALPTM